jgi:hypothetical protein
MVDEIRIDDYIVKSLYIWSIKVLMVIRLTN